MASVRLCLRLFRLFSTVQICPETIRMGLQSPLRNSAAMRLRIMTMADIPAGMRLKEIAGWNQTTADWKRFLEASPGGCFAAEEDGRVCGTATTISFENRFAWVGMVLVDPEYRSRGIGTLSPPWRKITAGKTALRKVKIRVRIRDQTMDSAKIFLQGGESVQFRCARFIISGTLGIDLQSGSRNFWRRPQFAA